MTRIKVVIGLGLVLALVGYRIASSQEGVGAHEHHPSKEPDRATVVRQAQARRSGGLKAAAAVTGSYEGSADLSTVGGPINLEELVGTTPTIVVGTVSSNKMRLTTDGNDVYTYYSVSVVTVLKGGVKNRDEVVVAIPGGKVSFEDGSTAYLQWSEFRPPVNNRRYMFFMYTAKGKIKQADRPGDKLFEPVDARLGIYDLSGNIRANGSGARTPLGRELAKLDIVGDAFIATIRQVLGGVDSSR